jgi:hypothetical protein
MNSGMMPGGGPADLNILIHLLCIKIGSPRDVNYDVEICTKV